MSVTRRFKRTVENFTCEHCGYAVTGNGYTNHCPKCLYSKHVDINPGDRSATCGGLMAPSSLETKKGDQVLVHVCEKCGHTKRNKTVSEDDFEAILNVARSR